jgi:UDP-N-acetylglucosamine transferase subunit ALG13
MIFITSGSTNFPFTRLEAMAVLVAKYFPRERVIYQGIISGEIIYPQNISFKSLLNYAQFSSIIKKSKIILTHAGYGSIMNILKYSKYKPLVIPRMRRYKEHVNDHQVNFARFMAEKKLITLINNNKDLQNNLDQIQLNKAQAYLLILKKRKKTLISYLHQITTI